jgi:hypothetical protein
MTHISTIIHIINLLHNHLKHFLIMYFNFYPNLEIEYLKLNDIIIDVPYIY